MSGALRAVAPGKTNLCLYLGPVRPEDGRHELVSVMQSLTLADELTMAPAAGEVDEVVCADVVGDNLALAALRLFREATGWDGPPQRIEIAKHVPIAAGMGGGSGDAAAALRLARAVSGLGDDALLHRIAARLGADVPAQVVPGRALATGAGERLERLAPPPVPYGVLVLPSHVALSTADVFRAADAMGIGRSAEELAERLALVREFGADLPDALVHNDLEAPARSLVPEIGRALMEAVGAGADRAFVSGSGPTVIGLFADPNEARAAAERLARRDPPARYAEPVAAGAGDVERVAG